MELILPASITDHVKSEDGALLRADCLRWVGRFKNAPWFKRLTETEDPDLELGFNALFAGLSEFRSLISYRLKGRGKIQAEFTAIISDPHGKFRPASELYIMCDDIGPGLFLQHAYYTIILARKIGSFFAIGQCCTIGSHHGIPTIGDRVQVNTGAVVVGPITIGNDAVITANCVVACDMAAGMTAYAPRTVFKPRRG